MRRTGFVREHGWALTTALVLLAVLAAPPALAQDHDLVMFTLDASPKPLERGCSASLQASFLINGHRDDELGPGATAIEFYWAPGSAPVPTSPSGWTPIGTLSVGWNPGTDGDFGIGREWPTHFPSASPTTVSWNVPSSGNTFHLRAVAVYTGSESDDVPHNNEAVVANVPATDGNCGTPGCFMVGGVFVCLAPVDEGIYRIPKEVIPCLLDPDRCGPRLPPLPLCRVIDCNPCLLGLSCPPEPWNILIRWPEEVARFELLANGDPIARSERVRRPVPNRERIYQVLRFEPEKGVEYSLRLKAGPRAKRGEVLPLELEVQPAKQFR